MQRIILSLAIIIGLTAATYGGTVAFFSDTETSSNNNFTAGAVDLQIDNDTYYNGQYITGLSFLQKDLEAGDLFYAFDDVKPGDWGENTISLHVYDNDSWLCMNVAVARSDEHEITEPEVAAGDVTPEGELDQSITFLYWADDGDNVLESDEQATAFSATSTTITLADSVTNIWNTDGSPFEANQTEYIGMGWCFGAPTIAAVQQDGLSDGSINNPTTDPGFSCDGSQESNITQTDSLELDISFSAVQSRNTTDFLCQPEIIVSEPLTCSSYAESRRFTDLNGNPIDDPSGMAGAGDIRVFSITEPFRVDSCLLLYSRGAPGESGNQPRDVWEFTVSEAGNLDVSVKVGNGPDLTVGDDVMVTDPYGVQVAILIKRSGDSDFTLIETKQLSGTEAEIVSHDYTIEPVAVGDVVRIRLGSFVGRPAADVTAVSASAS